MKKKFTIAALIILGLLLGVAAYTIKVSSPEQLEEWYNDDDDNIPELQFDSKKP